MNPDSSPQQMILANCPFCGSPAKIHQWQVPEFIGAKGREAWSVECTSERGHCPMGRHYLVGSALIAAEAWNKRATPESEPVSAGLDDHLYELHHLGNDLEEWCEIRIRKDLIPKGANLVEAYMTEKEIVVMGNPKEDDDSHDCDAMGCGTLSHVLYRLPLPKPRELTYSPAERNKSMALKDDIEICKILNKQNGEGLLGPATLLEPATETPRTMRCWRNGQWQADELANLSSKLERENAELQATINTLHDLCVSAEKRAFKKIEEERAAAGSNDQAQPPRTERVKQPEP